MIDRARREGKISIHSLLAEGDAILREGIIEAGISIHSLLAEGDTCPKRKEAAQWSISIHSLLAEGDATKTVSYGGLEDISIHSLLAEGDLLLDKVTRPIRISIHSLLAEGDDARQRARKNRQSFQSTPSSRRETARDRCRHRWCPHFNPLPPRGGRPLQLVELGQKVRFQSTPSSRRETRSSPMI